jgi:hypothetical protein
MRTRGRKIEVLFTYKALRDLLPASIKKQSDGNRQLEIDNSQHVGLNGGA